MLNRRAKSLVRTARVGTLLLVFSAVLSTPSQLFAGPILSITTPDFLIPLNNQSGTLTVYSDGSAPTTTGFPSLGSQSFVLGANSTSTGWLTLNLVFSGFPLGDPSFLITDAFLNLTVTDFDFITDQVTRSITLKEYAVIKSVNDDPLYSPINLANYLPSGTTTTDDVSIALKPIDLMPPLTADDFTNPFVISLKLTAVAKNTGTTSVYVTNTPESLISNVKLTLNGTPVPEPSTLLMLGCSALMFGARRIRQPVRRSVGGAEGQGGSPAA